MSRSRVFRAITREGSTLYIKYREKGVHLGMSYGDLKVVGRSITAGEEILIEGIGFFPEQGSRVIVSTEVKHSYVLEDEEIKAYPQETIIGIKELDTEKYTHAQRQKDQKHTTKRKDKPSK